MPARADRPSDAELLEAIAVHGNQTAAARALGFPPRTFSDWVREIGGELELTRVSVNASGGVSRSYKPADPTLPARVDGWKRPKPRKTKKSDSQLIAVPSDVHAPLQDPTLEKKFEDWLYDNQPDRAILNGDLCENAGTSRWRNRPGQPTEQECVDGGYRWLRNKIDVSPDTEWDWVDGNHDKRTVEYAQDNAPEVAGLARAETKRPVLSVEHLLRLDELRVTYHRGYPLAKIKLSDNLVVTHGTRVKKGAGSSALANLEKMGFSVVTGHTHRLAVVFKTVLDADDTPSTICGAETGCMKLIEPEAYDVAPDHQNGFLTITLYRDGQFHIEPALFSGGHLRWRDKRY